MKNLIKAMSNVMEELQGGIEKNSTVGYGRNAYNAVSDIDVKRTVGRAMITNGLVVVPINIEATHEVDLWEEENKKKRSIFTTVKTTYKLLHESGEFIEFQGYGHGIDSQDKAAGKATTYALKYALLYLFMIPTGKIDDSDVDVKNVEKIKTKEELTPAHPKWSAAVDRLADEKTKDSQIAAIENARKYYSISDVNEKKLLDEAAKMA